MRLNWVIGSPLEGGGDKKGFWSVFPSSAQRLKFKMSRHPQFVGVADVVCLRERSYRRFSERVPPASPDFSFGSFLFAFAPGSPRSSNRLNAALRTADGQDLNALERGVKRIQTNYQAGLAEGARPTLLIGDLFHVE